MSDDKSYIILSGDPDLDDKVLTLMPLIAGIPADVTTDLGKAIPTWRCGSIADGTTLPISALPTSCQGL